MTPKILHIDMNKFYASVEQMLNPQLKNKAIAVCGSTEERHGIVLTASAEAKARGVKFGRPAKKLPNNIFVILEQISANRISIRAASRTYDIPKTTLWRLVKEAPQNAVARSSQSIS